MNKIKILREENGWTQNFLAEKMNISRQVLSNYENEINQPSPDMLIKFANIFQCSIDYLLGREDDFGVIAINDKTAELSPDGKELLTIFDSLAPEYQAQILEYTRYFYERSVAQKRKKEHL